MNVYQKNKQNAITLIALVITIIVLLILTGIAISTTVGSNGIFTKAKEAKRLQVTAEAKEKIGAEILDAQVEAIERNEELEQAQVEDIISKYGTLQDDKDTIILKDNGYTISLLDIYQGTTTSSGSYTENKAKMDLLEGQVKRLQEQLDSMSQTGDEKDKTIAELTEKVIDTENELTELKGTLGKVTATESQILKDYTAYKDGKLITGTMTNYAGQTVTASTVKQNGDNAEINIPSAGYYETDSKIAISLETLKKNIPSLSAASQVTPSDLTQLTQTSSNSWTASANGLVMVAVTAKCTNWGSVSSSDATYANYYIQKNGVDQNSVGFCAFNTNVNYTSKYTGFKVNAGDTFTIRRKTASEETNPDAVSAGYYTSSWNASMQIFFAH